MLEVIFKNFLSFDFIIFILAVVNGVILVQTIRFSRKLYDALNPYCWIPGGEASLAEIQGKFARRNRVDSESDIIRLRRRMNAFYIIYENLTAIFPLLGLLGTVVALIPLVNSMGEVPTGLFFSALTSTMWGIIFAIAFKVANGYVASGIEDNEKNIDIYLQRNTDKLLRERAIATSAEYEPEKPAETETAKEQAEGTDAGADSSSDSTRNEKEAGALPGTADAARETAADTGVTGADSAAPETAGADSAVTDATAADKTDADATATAVTDATEVTEITEGAQAGNTVEKPAEHDPYAYEPVRENKRPDPSELAPEFFGAPQNKENADEKA
jgi:chemotaxis protein MotA